MTLYIGLMSGTSMDGIDAALVEQPTNTFVSGLTKAYSDEVKQRLDNLLSTHRPSLAELCQLNTLIGREFSWAVHDLLQETGLGAHEIKAIGSHGQTICHDPYGSIPYTLQLGCGHTIASLTGIKVIADFRTKDIVNGGQGAPFAPIYHRELFAQCNESLALVNIGGIANVTFLNPNQVAQGWDTGPGNCLLDAWIKKQLGKSFDADGAWAQEGQLIKPLVKKLLADPYFTLGSPKSIGKEYFSLAWLEQQLEKEYNPIDVQASLVALTAQSIAAALANQSIQSLYLCGGGAHNVALKQSLAAALPDLKIQSIAEAGFSPDYLEAMMFSWFAFKTINEFSVDLSPITGSKGPAILGALYNN